jgi:chromosome segregation ATPase
MNERNLAKDLALLATEVDSLAKALAQAKAELERETERHRRAQTELAEVRQQLRYARRRAHKAEREFANLAATIETAAHTAQGHERKLRTQLDQALAVNSELREQVERKEGERRALEGNLRELMDNLRCAAEEAGRRTAPDHPAEDEVTLVRQPRNGDQ